MREIKVTPLVHDFDIGFNVVNNWFHTHIDPRNETIAEFLQLNEKFPIGPMRTQAYKELQIEKIRQAGLYEKFDSETKSIIEEGTKLWNDYDFYLNNLDKRCAQICNAANAVVNQQTLDYFKFVYETNEELSNVPGPTRKPSLHWLRERIETYQTGAFSDGKLTKEEILDLIDEAIRRP